jgi:nucleoside 2-deoxyribosyltransferase
MKCFVIMPFAKEFEDVYALIRSAITISVPGEEIECGRLDEIKGAGRISDDLVKEIQESTICIADITKSNPNVMWEVGFAMAMKKPIIFITQDVKDLPFDIKDMRAILYDRTSLHKTLFEELQTAFRDTLGKYEIRRDTRIIGLPPKATPRTIAITGSMNGNFNKCNRRIEWLLEPYLRDDVLWLCGSFGLADECAISYLAERKQKVLVVGYNAFDISEHTLEMIEKYEIPFIDANTEQLPKHFIAPTDRDLLFLTRADLVILMWNGESIGTQEMTEFYKGHQRDFVLGFF